jgi:hypothetical protein
VITILIKNDEFLFSYINKRMTESEERNYLEWLISYYKDGDIRVKAYQIAKEHFGPDAFNLFATNGYAEYLKLSKL